MRSMHEILKLVCTFLNGEEVEYVVVGGLAVLFYGIPRTTMDIDLIIAADMAETKQFVEFLKANDFFADEGDIKVALEEKSHATIEDKTSMIRLDIKGIYTENDLITLKRRRKINLTDFEFYVASPEDTIANKLLFGSEQDIKDAEGIYVRQFDNLETGYLTECCNNLDVLEEFSAMKRRVERYMVEKGG
ncbi:MAG: nucleotidyl transferase AbiEii/AbiGii toxin family protein [Methanophagales archaeon]|nr:nucleotidyl transferase AbiEii/AbiGii toxin family protein [Methanophagales archaeon]